MGHIDPEIFDIFDIDPEFNNGFFTDSYLVYNITKLSKYIKFGLTVENVLNGERSTVMTDFHSC